MSEYEYAKYYIPSYHITKDMLQEDLMNDLDGNPYNFLTQHIAWFEWEREVHFDGVDPQVVTLSRMQATQKRMQDKIAEDMLNRIFGRENYQND